LRCGSATSDKPGPRSRRRRVPPEYVKTLRSPAAVDVSRSNTSQARLRACRRGRHKDGRRTRDSHAPSRPDRRPPTVRPARSATVPAAHRARDRPLRHTCSQRPVLAESTTFARASSSPHRASQIAGSHRSVKAPKCVNRCSCYPPYAIAGSSEATSSARCATRTSRSVRGGRPVSSSNAVSTMSK
jgi:hypothetical protein